MTPSLGRSGSYKVNHGPTDAQKRAMMMGRSMLATQNSFGGYRGAYGGYDEGAAPERQLARDGDLGRVHHRAASTVSHGVR